MVPTQTARITPAQSTANPGVGGKFRGAMAMGKTRWGMLALVFFKAGRATVVVGGFPTHGAAPRLWKFHGRGFSNTDGAGCLPGKAGREVFPANFTLTGWHWGLALSHFGTSKG